MTFIYTYLHYNGSKTTKIAQQPQKLHKDIKCYNEKLYCHYLIHIQIYVANVGFVGTLPFNSTRDWNSYLISVLKLTQDKKKALFYDNLTFPIRHLKFCG